MSESDRQRIDPDRRCLWGCVSRQFCHSRAEILFEKQRDGRIEIVAVGLLLEAVPLVVGVDRPDRFAVGPHFGDDLLRSVKGTRGSFRPWATSSAEWIFWALLSGSIRVKKARILRVAFVAVFRPAEILPIGAGRLEHGVEAGDADDATPARIRSL